VSRIPPAHIVGMEHSLRSRPAGSMFKTRPKTGANRHKAWPERTVITSAPASRRAVPASVASSIVVPPGIASEALRATARIRSRGQTWRTASSTRTGKARRAEAVPPNPSWRWLVNGERKVAVAELQLQPVETQPGGLRGRGAEVGHDLFQAGRLQLGGHLAARPMGERRGGDQGPGGLWREWVIKAAGPRVTGAAGTGMQQLQTDPAAGPAAPGLLQVPLPIEHEAITQRPAALGGDGGAAEELQRGRPPLAGRHGTVRQPGCARLALDGAQESRVPSLQRVVAELATRQEVEREPVGLPVQVVTKSGPRR